MIDLPAEAGSYALHLALEKPQHIRVGALGEVDFPASEYVYLGSAAGPGGLRARVGRHLRADKTRHWHIDYLVPMTKLLGLCWTTSPDPLECRWSQALARLPVVSIPVSDFGSSDCRARGGSCRAHLVALPTGVSPAELWAALSTTVSDEPIVLVSLSNQDTRGTTAPLR